MLRTTIQIVISVQGRKQTHAKFYFSTDLLAVEAIARCPIVLRTIIQIVISVQDRKQTHAKLYFSTDLLAVEATAGGPIVSTRSKIDLKIVEDRTKITRTPSFQNNRIVYP